MTTSLLDTMLRKSIGLDPYFFAGEPLNFPPHTITQEFEENDKPTGNYRLTMAVAGFSEADIKIALHSDILTVQGIKRRKPEPDKMYHTIYGGIAMRDFHREFKLGEGVYVKQASLKNGLLQIDLAQYKSEVQQPKVIPINTEN